MTFNYDFLPVAESARSLDGIESDRSSLNSQSGDSILSHGSYYICDYETGAIHVQKGEKNIKLLQKYLEGEIEVDDEVVWSWLPGLWTYY